jgi:hypothetical protein
MNDALRQQLVAMAAEDARVRAELAATGELFRGYAPVTYTQQTLPTNA